MKNNLQELLEKAARQMILIHNSNTLIKLILRTITRAIDITHAGIFTYNEKKDSYVVTISRGQRGYKLPPGFAKITRSNPIIRFFLDPAFENLRQDILLEGDVLRFLREYKDNPEIYPFLENLHIQFDLLQAKVCIPGFFRKHLIGVLFLGEKKDKKPFAAEELRFFSVLASDVVMAIQNAWLFENLQEQLDKNKKLFINTVSSLANAIEAKDKYTIGHTERVVYYSLKILDALPAMKELINRENFRIAALLHDIGKIGVPEGVLNKIGKLSDEEWEIIKRHPLIGAEILKPLSEFEGIIEGVCYHHERYDGKGYPYGLQGEQIPITAAIIAVADSYDAMTSDRPYRKALSVKEACEELIKNKGNQFNPLVVETFLRVIEEENKQ